VVSLRPCIDYTLFCVSVWLKVIVEWQGVAKMCLLQLIPNSGSQPDGSKNTDFFWLYFLLSKEYKNTQIMHLLKNSACTMVIHRSVNAEARFQPQATPCETFRGQSGSGDRFLFSNFNFFTVSVISPVRSAHSFTHLSPTL
jgi:hypothetical protein